MLSQPSQSSTPLRSQLVYLSIFLLPTLALPALGCKTNSNPSEPLQGIRSLGDAVPAQGWSEAKIVSSNWNSRTLSIDLMGHFHFTLDACFRDSWGVYDLQLWNRLAQSINVAVENIRPIPLPSASPTPVSTPVTGNPYPRPTPRLAPSPQPTQSPSPEPENLQCFERDSRETFSFDGRLEVTSDSSKWNILEIRGDQVCTPMSDLNRARELYRALNEAIEFAAYDDCPENRPH